MTLEIKSFLVLSTTHIKYETSRWLEDHQWLYGDYGFFLYANEGLLNFPEDLRTVMAFARKHGCEYLLLDRDADTTEELPQYDW